MSTLLLSLIIVTAGVSGTAPENGCAPAPGAHAENDLLVWFAPRADCRLQVVDRLSEDARALACPAQVRYVWEGTPKAGETLVFTQVYYPHAPYKPAINSNHAGARAVYADELRATAGASGIQVVRDDPEASVLRLELEPGKVEWVVFNPRQVSVDVAGRQTKSACEYVPSGRDGQ